MGISDGRGRFFAPVLVAVAVLAALFAGASPASAVDVSPSAAPAVEPATFLGTDELIVTPVAGDSLDASSLATEAGTTVQVGRRFGSSSYVVKLARRFKDADIDALAARWTKRSDVAIAEPNRIRRATATPNDPSYANQWDMKAPVVGSYGANLPGAWDVTTGSPSVTVAVLDTGKTNHADLAGKFVGGYDFIGDTQVANDGGGRDSDPSDPGDWVTAAENAAGYFKGCGASNSSWHGTHVSGTIGAATNNSLGVAGIAWNSKIVMGRVLGKCGGYDSDIIDALKWAAGLSVSGVPANANPAQVISLSLGGTGACSAAWQTAINSVVAAGVSIVIAAGNENANASTASPGNCANVITVAATGPTGNRSYYSNYGTGVEIAAPGGDSQVGPTILSTLNAGTTTPGADSYAYYQGTSMATPHVAGVVALIKSVRPTATPAQVLAYLQGNVTPFPAGSTCTTALCGSGILNASAAVRAAASVPAAPGTPTATAGNGQASVTWTAPATDGGTPVTGYTVTPFIGAAAQTASVFASTATTQTVGGLTNGTSYTFKVAATNVIGTGAQSAASNAVVPTAPLTAPGAPGTPTATAGNAQASLTWTAPASDGGSAVIGYTVTPFIGAAAQTASVFASTATTQTVGGLTNGTSYTFKVAATNGIGTGAQSVASNAVTPLSPINVPGAPGVPTAVPGDGQSSLTWTAPATDGGSPITGYRVTPSIDGVAQAPQSFASTATAQTVTGLANGSLYTFTVAATNVAGTGAESASSGEVWPHAGLAQLRVGDARVNESAGVALVPVSLSKPTTVSVTVKTKDGTALAGSDFNGITSQVLAFTANGPTTQLVSIPLIGGTDKELVETFTVTASASAKTVAPADLNGDVTIVDDDGLPAQIWVSDVPTVDEGGNAVFTVGVQGRVDQAATVPYATATGTADATDFTATSGSLSFAAGEIDPVRTVSVPVADDATSEGVEAFTLKLTTVKGLTFTDAVGSASIAPSDGGTGKALVARRIRVDDVQVSEAAGVAHVVVRIDQTAAATVKLATKDAKALAGSDYTAVNQTVSFTSGGPTAVTVDVPISADGVAELDETFTVALTAATGATIADTSGTVTVLDDEGVPSVRISDVTVHEGQNASFLVSVDGPVDQALTVTLATVNGTALSGSDFGALSTTSITFPAGSANPTRVVTVPIVADGVAEAVAGEKFTVKLTLATGSIGVLGDNVGTALILD